MLVIRTFATGVGPDILRRKSAICSRSLSAMGPNHSVGLPLSGTMLHAPRLLWERTRATRLTWPELVIAQDNVLHTVAPTIHLRHWAWAQAEPGSRGLSFASPPPTESSGIPPSVCVFPPSVIDSRVVPSLLLESPCPSGTISTAPTEPINRRGTHHRDPARGTGNGCL